MQKFLLGFFLIILGFNILALAQSKKFRWSSDLCQYEGTYDSKKYTLAQLKNTLRLAQDEFNLNTSDATVFKFEDLASRDFARIEADYQKKSAELKSLNIIKSMYWENVRRQKLKEIETYYFLSKATLAGYTMPESLREYPYADSCKTKYAEPLIKGGDSLLKVWEILNIESRKNNGDPAGVKRRFESEKSSPDALKFAVVEVTTFGWWNCANALIDQGDNYEIKEKNFKRLFTRVRTIDCEEP